MDSSRPFKIIISLLLGISVVMVLSASAMSASKYGSAYFFFYRQLIWVAIGLVGLLTAYKIDLNYIKKISPYAVLLVVGLLLAVFIPGLGVVRNGARRWISFGAVGIQPSELSKLAMVLGIAWYLSRNKNPLDTFKKVAIAYAGIISLAGIIILEPDFGTSSLICVVGGLMLFVAGLKYRYFLPVVPLGLVAVYVLIIDSPYRMARIVAFLNPWEDPKGKGYHIIQSMIALGQGGLCGTGLGEGRQKLSFLPEAHTDFILAIIGQELGFVGILFILGLFVAFSYFGYRLYTRLNDAFSAYFVFGFITLVTLQAIFNIAVVSGTIPTKGIALPFVSFGGSGLITLLIGVGIVLNIASHPELCDKNINSNS